MLLLVLCLLLLLWLLLLLVFVVIGCLYLLAVSRVVAIVVYFVSVCGFALKFESRFCLFSASCLVLHSCYLSSMLLDATRMTTTILNNNII